MTRRAPAAVVDVVVIGAGIAGAAAAAALSGRARVVLVEAEPHAGWHATGRSAALLNETAGDPVVCRLAGASRPFWVSPPAGFADQPLLTPRGLLWVAAIEARGAIERLAGVAPHAAERIDAEAARRIVSNLTPAAVAGGAVWEPGAMAIDVAAALSGFLRQVRRGGSTLRTSAEAVAVEQVGSGWAVTAGDDRIECDVVVNAAGAWGDVVAKRAGIVPLGLQALRRTAALVPAPAEAGDWPMVMDAGGAWYAEPEAGGLLISPADEQPCEPCDARPAELDVALAIDRVNDALGVQIRSVRRAWAGLRTFCSDRRPAVGRDPDAPGFVWLVGQGGGGIKTAPALATLVAAIVLDGERPPPELDPARLR